MPIYKHFVQPFHVSCSWTTARRWPCVFVHLTTRWMLCNIMGWGGVGMMTFRALCNIMGWGGVGMTTFRALDNMLDAMQHHGLGWGGDDDVPCTWQHVGCYATSWVGVGWGWWRSVHLTTCWMLCNIMGWGGVGMMTFHALDNMLDAMQHHGLWCGGDDDVPCTWQHVGCYATSWVGVGWGWWRSVHLTTCWMLCNIMGWGGVGMMTFRALDNMLDAMRHHGLGWGGDDDVPCTWQHVGFYATSWVGVGWGWWRSMHLTTCWMLRNIMGWVGVGMMTFRALDNMLDAMQHHGLWWGGDDDVPCTWQHVGCYATSWVGVGWGWWRSVHLTTCWMLCNIMGWGGVGMMTFRALCNIMGWGGVGMMTFRALDNRLDTMQHHGLGWGGDDGVPCTWQHFGCYATSWVGVGWGWWRSVHLTTFHSTSFGSKNQVVLGTLIWGFLILNYNGNFAQHFASP